MKTISKALTAGGRRHRFRFTTRTILLAMLLLGALFGWLALHMRAADRQHEAVRASIPHTQVTDAGTVHLAGLTRLQTLILPDGRPPADGVKRPRPEGGVTDSGLKWLRRQLRECQISRW